MLSELGMVGMSLVIAQLETRYDNHSKDIHK